MLWVVFFLNNLVFEWGKLNNISNNWTTYNLNISCNIFAFVGILRDANHNEYGAYSKDYTKTSFQACVRGYGGGSLSNCNFSYILIGSI